VTTESIPDSEHIIGPSSQTLQGNGKASDSGGHQPSLKKLAMEREGRRTSSLSHGGASILHHKKTVGPAELAGTSSKSGLSQETSTQPRCIITAGWVATKWSASGQPLSIFPWAMASVMASSVIPLYLVRQSLTGWVGWTKVLMKISPVR
jgi:hypothetical protein